MAPSFRSSRLLRAGARVAAACAVVALPLAAQHAPAAHAHHADTTRGTMPPGVGAADVRFMQGMIAHHAQALVMAGLLPSRTARADLKLLAERIRVSQEDEIAAMQAWLRARGQAVPQPATTYAPAAAGGEHAAHHAAHHAAGDSAHAAMHAQHLAAGGHGAAGGHDDHAGMPGMLTAAQLDTLATAKGRAFERLFLRYMIAHHEGAITMVRQLFATPGAGQEPQLYGFAADVDADQQAEIRRMRALLARLPAGPRTR